MSEERKLFIEKLIAILYTEILKNKENEIIMREYKRIQFLCQNSLTNFIFDCNVFGTAYTGDNILDYLIFSYKADFIVVRRKVIGTLLFQSYNKDIDIFIESMELTASHIYDLVYLNWNNPKYNRKANIFML